MQNVQKYARHTKSGADTANSSVYTKRAYKVCYYLGVYLNNLIVSIWCLRFVLFCVFSIT